MATPWDLLIASARLEDKKELLHILKDLAVSPFTASNVAQACEVLAAGHIRLVFSEENFADGSYRDLLTFIRISNLHVGLVLILSSGEWQECLEGFKRGVVEVIRCPLQATDVELSLIRAARNEEFAVRTQS